MGADLFIKKLSEHQKAKYEPLFTKAVRKRNSAVAEADKQKAQKAVDKYYDLMYSKGYFRDPYNIGSVMGRMGLSWWQDVEPLLNRDAELTPAKAGGLLIMVLKSKVQPMTAKELKEHHATVDDGDNSPVMWLKCWQADRRRLIRFLKQAIEMDEPIYCSL